MTLPNLRRFGLALLRDKTSADPVQVPFAGATVSLYRRGATVSTAVSISNGSYQNVDIYDLGNIKAGDDVYVGVSHFALRVDSIVSPTRLSLLNLTGQPVALAIGDRLVPNSLGPIAYADPHGEVSLGSSLTADASGRIGVYVNATPFDYIVSAASVVFDAQSHSTLSGAGSTLTWSHTVGGANRVVLVGVSWQETTDSETLDAVTYGGTAMNYVGSAIVGTVKLHLYSLSNAPTGAQNVIVTWSGTGAKGAIGGAVSVTNCDPVNPVGTAHTATSSTGTTAPSVTVPATGGWGFLFGLLGINSVASTTTVTAILDSQWSATAGTSGAFTRTQGAAETTAGTGADVALGWSLSSSKPWAVLAAEAKPIVLPRLVIDAEGEGFLHSPDGIIVTDYPSFQAAHDALPDTGGTIYVPAGTYSSSTVPAFEGLVITKPLALIGEGNGPAFSTTYIIHDMSNAANHDAIRINRGGLCVLKNFFLQGPGVPGSGRGVLWYLAGTAPMAGLTVDNVTIWRSANTAFEFVCDGRSDSYVSKLEMLGCTAYESASGGSLFLGGAGTNNNVFERCEFSGPAYGGFNNVASCAVTESLTNVSSTSSFANVLAGDVVFGMGVAYGTTVASVDMGTNSIELSVAAVETFNHAVDPSTESTTLSFYRSSAHTVTGCTYARTSATVHASSVSTIHVGDTVAGADIVVGSTVVAVNTGANTFDLSQKPIGDHPTATTLTISAGPGTGQLPRGHAHLLRTSISRFSHCSFQGPGTTPALTTDLVSNDLELRDSYREKSTGEYPVHSFQVNGMTNLLIDGLYQLFHLEDSLLLKTGPLGLLMGRITNAQVITTLLEGTDVVHLSNATDGLVIDNASEVSLANGTMRDLVVAGAGAVIPRISSQGTIALPNGSDEAFIVTGDDWITNITICRPKRRVTLLFSSLAQLQEGGNLKLNGTFFGNTNRTITLLCDGTYWWELGRGMS